MNEIVLPMYVTSQTGTRFYLSQDYIDDVIVQELITYSDLFFPAVEEDRIGQGAILNIGGHHGLYASEALTRYPKRKFIIVEPHPGWCKLIKKNVIANGGGSRTEILPACLAPDLEKRILYFDKDRSWGATVEDPVQGSQEVKVESMHLDLILSGQYPALIYSNAEGAEYTLAQQLYELDIRPEIVIMMVHPEYGNVQLLRNNMKCMDYVELDKTLNSTRPIYHYFLNKGQ
jgi:FkbM family methyltransferase